MFSSFYFVHLRSITYKYFILYKPFSMLSQFSREGDNKALADLKFNFPKDVPHPVGRLDSDSEGLLLLTNDKSINHKLLDPKFKHNRTYLAQVEGIFTEEAKRKLKQGVEISVDRKKIPNASGNCRDTS